MTFTIEVSPQQFFSNKRIIKIEATLQNLRVYMHKK